VKFARDSPTLGLLGLYQTRRELFEFRASLLDVAKVRGGVPLILEDPATGEEGESSADSERDQHRDGDSFAKAGEEFSDLKDTRVEVVLADRGEAVNDEDGLSAPGIDFVAEEGVSVRAGWAGYGKGRGVPILVKFLV
jgi:hypothetical protein